MVCWSIASVEIIYNLFMRKIIRNGNRGLPSKISYQKRMEWYVLKLDVKQLLRNLGVRKELKKSNFVYFYSISTRWSRLTETLLLFLPCFQYLEHNLCALANFLWNLIMGWLVAFTQALLLCCGSCFCYVVVLIKAFLCIDYCLVFASFLLMCF